jgi:hypothetical protein
MSLDKRIANRALSLFVTGEADIKLCEVSVYLAKQTFFGDR